MLRDTLTCDVSIPMYDKIRSWQFTLTAVLNIDIHVRIASSIFNLKEVSGLTLLSGIENIVCSLKD